MTDIENLTPAHLRCTYTLSCPNVHRLEDGRLLIVGEDATADVVHGNPRYAGASLNPEDETATIISPDLLSTVMQEEIEKATDPLLRENWQLKQALGYPIPAAFDTPQNPFKCGTCTARWNSFAMEIEKAVKAERERCAQVADDIADQADKQAWIGETDRGERWRLSDLRNNARDVATAIRSTPSQGDEG
jgi:hypothetical protein